MKVKAPHTVEELEERLAELPAELTYSFNLGMADVYPKTSGKVAHTTEPPASPGPPRSTGLMGWIP